MRRRPLLRAAAIGGGAYYAGKRRMEKQMRENEERALYLGQEVDRSEGKRVRPMRRRMDWK